MTPEHPVAIVTGAGTGIGRHIAAQLSSLKWAVTIAGRRSDKLGETGDQLEGPWLAVPTNVADPEDIDRLIASTIEQFGRIDGLINNAGVAPVKPIHEHDWNAIRTTFDVNTLGPAHAIARAWPHLVRSRGRIVNISSMAAVDPFPGFFAYAASKSAVEMLALCAANEGSEAGVRAFGVAPGAVETPMLRGLFTELVIPPENCLDPRDVARTVVECVTGRRDDMNGQTIRMPSP